ncbi:hypothetical protein LLP35_04260 [Ruminococcus albus]|nr:hypothetical protein [Ruminococcus albus]
MSGERREYEKLNGFLDAYSDVFSKYGRALKSIILVKSTSILEIRIETEQKIFTPLEKE